MKFESIPEGITSRYVQVEGVGRGAGQGAGLRLHALEAGQPRPGAEDEAVLLLHGWPTSAYLWRNVMPKIAAGGGRRVLALDLPGFGRSDKRLSDSFGFRYHEQAIEGFLAELGIRHVHLVVHDLGGPVGLYWAVRHPEALRSLTLLNTLVYPETSWAVKLFVVVTLLPWVRDYFASPDGLAFAMRFGVENKDRVKAAIPAYQAPFETLEAREVLLKTASRLSPKGLKEIRDKLPSLRCPTRLLYGEQDRILPDVAKTMARVAKDLPQAELSSLSGCGHFLQEDRPEEVGEAIARFLDGISRG